MAYYINITHIILVLHLPTPKKVVKYSIKISHNSSRIRFCIKHLLIMLIMTNLKNTELFISSIRKSNFWLEKDLSTSNIFEDGQK